MSANPSLIRQLSALGIHPRKGLGQNFLVDPSYRARIVAAAELTKADAVVEIGPGPGVLTELLAAQAGRVIAVELDDRLVPFLRERFAGQPWVSIVHGDILKVDVGRLMQEIGDHESPISNLQLPYKVVANLPYYITGAAIPHVLEAQPPPGLTVLTVQREVAERMVARPPDMSLLALGAQFYAIPEVVARIPAGAFYPAPKVDSAVVRLRRRAETAAPDLAPAEFFRVARAGFGQRRKQLRNSLSAGLGVPAVHGEAWLRGAGIDPARRAETLTLDEWAALAREIKKGGR